MDIHRVKVYKLNEEGTWDDTGTGHVNVEYIEVRIVFFSVFVVVRILVSLFRYLSQAHIFPCLLLALQVGVGLVVTSEHNASTLLVHSIGRNNLYQRQGGRSIWTKWIYRLTLRMREMLGI